MVSSCHGRLRTMFLSQLWRCVVRRILPATLDTDDICNDRKGEWTLAPMRSRHTWVMSRETTDPVKGGQAVNGKMPIKRQFRRGEAHGRLRATFLFGAFRTDGWLWLCCSGLGAACDG